MKKQFKSKLTWSFATLAILGASAWIMQPSQLATESNPSNRGSKQLASVASETPTDLNLIACNQLSHQQLALNFLHHLATNYMNPDAPQDCPTGSAYFRSQGEGEQGDSPFRPILVNSLSDIQLLSARMSEPTRIEIENPAPGTPKFVIVPADDLIIQFRVTTRGTQGGSTSTIQGETVLKLSNEENNLLSEFGCGALNTEHGIYRQGQPDRQIFFRLRSCHTTR